jgi:hypothetical protein
MFFICDFVTTIKFYQVDFFIIDYNPMIGYQCVHFQVFRDVVDKNFTIITQDWVVLTSTLM